MYVFMRHAEKQHDNKQVGVKYKFDSDLTEKGVQDSINKGLELHQRYPIVTKIITSPYHRARRTARLIASAWSQPPEIVVNPNLSEYLGNQKGNKVQHLHKETQKQHPPLNEDVQMFKKRLGRYHANLPVLEQDEVVVVITHGFCMFVLNELEGGGNETAFDSLVELHISPGPKWNPPPGRRY